MYFTNEGEIKTFPRSAKGERIHYQQTCITRNEKKENYTKWQSGSTKKKKSTRNDYFVGKYKLHLLLFKSL